MFFVLKSTKTPSSWWNYFLLEIWQSTSQRIFCMCVYVCNAMHVLEWGSWCLGSLYSICINTIQAVYFEWIEPWPKVLDCQASGSKIPCVGVWMASPLSGVHGFCSYSRTPWECGHPILPCTWPSMVPLMVNNQPSQWLCLRLNYYFFHWAIFGTQRAPSKYCLKECKNQMFHRKWGRTNNVRNENKTIMWLKKGTSFRL